MKKINIKESLIRLDMDTDFKHSLTDLYEACMLDEKKKEKLVQYIEDRDIPGMSKMLSNEANVMAENVSDDIADEDMPNDIKVESYVEAEDYLFDKVDDIMHPRKFLYARWADNHIVTPLGMYKYEVKHKRNGTRIVVEFDETSDRESGIKFTVDGKRFATHDHRDAQDIIIDELEKKNWKQFDLIVDSLNTETDEEVLNEAPGAMLGDHSEYRGGLKEATAVMDRPKISNVHTHRGSFSGIIDTHMDEINDMINASVPATHIVHCLRDWVSDAELTKANAKYAQNAMMRMAKMRSAEEVGMYLYNIRLKAEDDSFGSIDSQFYSKKHCYEDLNEELLRESTDEEDKPFTHSQVFDELKSETANFSVGEDRGIYSFEKEVKMAEKILKKHYETVKVTARGNDFMVEFSGPKNKKKKVNESVDSNFKSGDVVYVKPSKKLGRVVSVRGDYITVEINGGNDPDRRDTFYPSDLELQDSVNESKSLTESKERFELEVWVPGSGGDDDRERFIMASNNLQEIIDKAYEIELDSDEAFYLRDMKDIYPYDLDQCYDAEELEDAIYNEWHYEPSADMRKQLGKILLPQNEDVETSKEWEHRGKDGKIGRIRQSDGKGDRKPLTRDQAKEIAKFRGHEDDELYPVDESKSIKESYSITSEFDNLIAPIKDRYPEVDFIINAHTKLGCEVVADSNKERDIAEDEIINITNGTKFKYSHSANRMNKSRGHRAYVNIVFDFDDTSLDESKSMTADEMKAKHGTDNPDIINAGKPEEERVALKEDNTSRFHELSKLYKNKKVFTDREKESAHLLDFIQKLALHGISYEEYKHTTDPGCTIFYDGKNMSESLTEAMTYTDTNGFLGEPGEKYTMSQFRRMWQDRDNDPVMSGYDSFEEWVGETISQMDAHEDDSIDVAPSGRGKLSCATFTDKSGIMGEAGAKYTVNDLADYWEANRGSDPVLANYNGDWKKWLDDTVAQMEIEYDSCLFEESLSSEEFEIQNYKDVLNDLKNLKLNPTNFNESIQFRYPHVIVTFKRLSEETIDASVYRPGGMYSWMQSSSLEWLIEWAIKSIKQHGPYEIRHLEEGLESKTFTDREEAKKFAKDNKGAITSVVDDQLNPTHYVHYKGKEKLREEMNTLKQDVQTAIHHLTRDLGRDPEAEDFAEDVVIELEKEFNEDEIPSDPLKHREWASAVMQEVSRQLNNPMTEGTETSKEWEYTFSDGAKGRVRKANDDHTGRKELSKEEAQEIADYRGYKDGKLESVEEELLTENEYGKDELWSQLNNNEYAYKALSNVVRKGIEKGYTKEAIINLVRREIYSMKDDFGRLYTTKEERQELAKDFVEDELQGYSFSVDETTPSFKRRGTWSKNEAFGHPQSKGPFWYLCKHGVGPGALPKGVTVLDTVDDEENSDRVYVALDKVLTTDELKQFEMKEQKPQKMISESLDFFDTVTVILDDDMWGGYSKELEHKYNWYQGQVIFEDDPRLKKIGAKPGDTILCGLEHTDKFGDDDIDFDIVPIKVVR